MEDDPVAMRRFADEVAPELRNLIASVRDSATVEPMKITRVQPHGLVVSPAFSHVAVVPAGATTIYVGGQNGVDADGKIVSDDVAEQSAARSTTRVPRSRQRFIPGRCRAVDGVHGRGCRPQRRIRGIGPRLAGPGAPPLVTLARVAALGVPGALVEVSAIAAVVPG
jgi:enamine deaminase RidA (YjgF/YER057c/UK114 family)